MRAVIHGTFGDPAEVLEVAERPLPQPAPGEVRVRTVLSPIHNHDLWTIRGTYGFRPDLPAASGTEAFGVVTPSVRESRVSRSVSASRRAGPSESGPNTSSPKPQGSSPCPRTSTTRPLRR